MVSTFAGITLNLRRDNEGRLPLPEPVGTPVVRTPLVNGGTNIQVPGAKVMGVTYTLEFTNTTAYATMRAKISTLGSLVLTPGSLTLTYPNTLLESVSGVSIGRDGVLRATARFTMDGY